MWILWEGSNLSIPEGAIPVLDNGYVRLNEFNGSDLQVVNAARVSFNQRSASFGSREDGILKFLMRERHGTPFEHNMFSFEVCAPLFVNREWFRHRIASFNEESGRYSEIHPVFYIPKSRVRTQVGKPGSYSFERVPPAKDAKWCERIDQHSTEAFRLYRDMLEDGVAKEVARQVLTLNTYSTFWFTCNSRSLMNFISLRADPTAQEEIREYAKVLEHIFATRMPATHGAFVECGRVSP